MVLDRCSPRYPAGSFPVCEKILPTPCHAESSLYLCDGDFCHPAADVPFCTVCLLGVYVGRIEDRQDSDFLEEF
jgi:hypothetical protein